MLTEAFNVNLESLVTKDYLAARFAEQNANIDTRFAEQFAQQNMRWENRFAQLEAKVEGNHRVFIWTQAIIMAAVILPYLERLIAL